MAACVTDQGIHTTMGTPSSFQWWLVPNASFDRPVSHLQRGKYLSTVEAAALIAALKLFFVAKAVLVSRFE